MLKIIQKLKVPNVLLRHIMMNYLDLKTIQYIFLHYKKFRVLTQDNKEFLNRVNKGFTYCCENGYFTEVKWIHENNLLLFKGIDIHFNEKEIFMKTCKRGHIEIAKWLYGINKNFICDDDFDIRLIYIKGNLEIIKWLYELNVYINVIDLFDSSCEFGHFDLAKWTYEQFNIYVHKNIEYAFRITCAFGHFKIAKWLYSLNVNIYIMDNQPFRITCQNGHLEMAQWLYSLGANIHASKNYAFRYSCKNGHLKIAKWLYSIDPIVYNQEIFDIVPTTQYKILTWLHKINNKK